MKKAISVYFLSIFTAQLFPFFAMGQEAERADISIATTVGDSCNYVGRILMKPTDEKIAKFRLKVARPEDTVLQLKENYISASTVIIEQQESSQTYFTVMPDDGFVYVPDDGQLLDFSIAGNYDVSKISMTAESYVQLLGGEKVYVTEDPIYLEFIPINCVQKSSNPFIFTDVTDTQVDLRVPENYPAEDLVVMIDDIPYELMDTMVTLESDVLIIEPIVPLELGATISLVVRNKKNGEELLTKKMEVLSPNEVAEGRLQDIAEKSQEEREQSIKGPIGGITYQECDILRQFESNVVEVNKNQITALRNKLNCPGSDGPINNIVALQQVHQSAPEVDTGSRGIKAISMIGWISFAILVMLHIAQKVRRKHHLLQGEQQILLQGDNPKISWRGEKKQNNQHAEMKGILKEKTKLQKEATQAQKATEEARRLQAELQEAKAQLKLVYEHAKNVETRIKTATKGISAEEAMRLHDSIQSTKGQLQEMKSFANLVVQKVLGDKENATVNEVKELRKELKETQDRLKAMHMHSESIAETVASVKEHMEREVQKQQAQTQNDAQNNSVEATPTYWWEQL